MRDKVVDLIIGQISLLFTCINQLFKFIIFVIESQRWITSSSSRRTWKIVYKTMGTGDGELLISANLELYTSETAGRNPINLLIIRWRVGGFSFRAKVTVEGERQSSVRDVRLAMTDRVTLHR